VAGIFQRLGGEGGGVMPIHKVIALCGLCLTLGAGLMNSLWLYAVQQLLREIEGRLKKLEDRREAES